MTILWHLFMTRYNINIAESRYKYIWVAKKAYRMSSFVIYQTGGSADDYAGSCRYLILVGSDPGRTISLSKSKFILSPIQVFKGAIAAKGVILLTIISDAGCVNKISFTVGTFVNLIACSVYICCLYQLLIKFVCMYCTESTVYSSKALDYCKGSRLVSDKAGSVKGIL